MKKTIFLFLWAWVLAFPFFPRGGYAVEAVDAATSHLNLAASYEQKAATQDVVIAEHQQMKKDYREKFFVNAKVTPGNQVKEMENHCDALIQDARKLQAEYLEFAKWHRMRAAELQGR